MIADEEEPVAAPGDVAGHRANARDLHWHAGGAVKAGHVADGHAAVVAEQGIDCARGCFQLAGTAADLPQMSERDHYPYGAVAAHPEVPDVVEEDDAGLAGGVGRLA